MNTGTPDGCFALPPGVDWMPVDRAMELLRSGMPVIEETIELQVANGTGCVLARPLVAARNNPPVDNSAIDGYCFRLEAGQAIKSLQLIEGCSAPGHPVEMTVAVGQAIRVLTGASLPPGVNTVILEENVTIADGQVKMARCPKPGANTRKAGEDFRAGMVLFPAGHRLSPNDMATASGSGTNQIRVFRQLSVGVISTGDELVTVGNPAGNHEIYDMNRPMLLSMLARLGFDPVDLGRVPDDTWTIRSLLNDAAGSVDAVLTTGGASASEQDCISSLLKDEGELNFWRIAVKPGRPMAMARWKGMPVFGLPGNPIAAFVCTLVFAAPALRMMSGEQWSPPAGFMVPAAFTKAKKAGRREYLRARINDDGHAEVYQSEGSGLTAGLAWSDGLVELGDNARDLRKGERVKYVPYSSFGL